MNEYLTYLIQIIPFFIIATPLIIFHRLLELIKRHYKNTKTATHREIGSIFFMYSLVFIFSVTIGLQIYFISMHFISTHISEVIHTIVLMPLVHPIFNLLRSIVTGSLYGIVNVLGNIIMFLPLGFLVALLASEEKRKKYVLQLSFTLSFSIELIQIFIIRGFDINDIILNVLGGYLGYKIFLLFHPHFSSFFNKFQGFSYDGEMSKTSKYNITLITLVQVGLWLIPLAYLKSLVVIINSFISSYLTN